MGMRPKPTVRAAYPDPDESGVRVTEQTLLANNWYHLYRYGFDLRLKDGSWQAQLREAYDRGNGATILLYNRARRTVVLTRQFRLPAFAAGLDDAWMLETAAGLLDEDRPEDAILRETMEETGYRIARPERLFELMMSPGSVTERIHFFTAEYDPADRPGKGGGADGENENIEVVELDFDEALAMVRDGRIADAKTVVLLYHARVEGLL
jgi:nudix-type nucleoside diphosphatase (YffH/AdpP family)